VRILVTGGAGFIGSNFIHHMLRAHPDDSVVNLDKLTYAGNLKNLADVADDPRYRFVKGDICDAAVVEEALGGGVDGSEDAVDAIVNFAAETHVDRSISGPEDFIRTDVLGTHVLLEAMRSHGIARYLQISTDEVYGSIEQGSFTEADPLCPSSPYSASKAGADLQVLAYHATYGLPVLITRSSNNYGPFQYPEKLIPLFATNALDSLQLPVYGDGQNVRDWIHVDDNCAAVDVVLRSGTPGEVYNIGGGNERTNMEITRLVLQATGRNDELIRYVGDRPGHDRRYSVDAAKTRALGWEPRISFADGIAATVAWYRDRRDWWEPIKSGEWKDFYAWQYAELQGG
jgi:dTDP-glucose 4,6-dehydratase